MNLLQKGRPFILRRLLEMWIRDGYEIRTARLGPLEARSERNVEKERNFRTTICQ
jgi:hypothetical protein